MKKYNLPIFAVIFISVFIRLSFFLHSPYILVTPDSQGYYEQGIKILKSGELVHHSRPFVYPLFVNLLMLIQNKFAAPYFSTAFYEGARQIFITQLLLGLIGLLFINKILLRLGLNDKISAVTTGLIGCDIMLILEEKAMLTESLSIFLMILISYYSLKIFSVNKPRSWLILTALFFLLIFTKPVFAILPFFSVPIILIFSRKSRKTFLYGFFSLLFILMTVTGYSCINKIQNGYFGISRIGDINLLGQILFFKLDIKGVNNALFLKKCIGSFLEKSSDPSPFSALERCDSDVYNNPQIFKELQVFNREVIFQNLAVYLWRSYTRLPAALFEGNPIFSMLNLKDSSPYSAFMNFLYNTYCLIKRLTIFIVFLLPIIFFKAFFKKDRFSQKLTLLGISCFFLIAVTLPFTFYDYGRLLSPVEPLLFIFISASFVKIRDILS